MNEDAVVQHLAMLVRAMGHLVNDVQAIKKLLEEQKAQKPPTS